jgi:Fe2+ or Zn2+ uptake regulation protein
MTNENQINGLLQQHNLKKTPARVKVLRTLLSSKFAASYAELEQSTKELADRISGGTVDTHFFPTFPRII